MDAKTIKLLRKLEAITQHQLAERIGCSRSLIAQAELEYIPVTRQLEQKITNAFGLSRLDRVKQAMQIFEGDGDDDV
jgi:transcriptional regulator with XRE-family HTH domain